MRVLMVSHYALPHLGGIEVAIDGFARQLLARGHEVRHVASGALRRGEFLDGGEPAAYEVTRVPALNALEDRLGVPYPVFAPGLLRALAPRVAWADVVHAHGYLYLSSLAALQMARRRAPAARRVLTEHVGQVPYDSDVLATAQRLAATSLGRATTRSAQALVALNANVDRELARLAPDRPRRILGNGVDTERYQPAAARERERLRASLGWDAAPRVLFVGRLVAKKGLDVALEVAAAEPSLRLVVAGPGKPLRDVPANVEVLGALAPARVADLYRAADTFLLPSRGEGFPVTVQEAMASGLPVVLGADPAYAAQLDGAASGALLVDPDPAAVLAALRPLLADDAARREAGAAAARHARRRFGWDAVVDELLGLYAGPPR